MISDSISENILSFISGLGIIQGFLLAALIYFHPKSDRSVNLFLALYIIGISLVMSTVFILRVVPWQKTYTVEALPLLMGPLLYLYIRSFKETITWRKALPHFIPYLTFAGLSFWYLSTLAAPYADAREIPPELVRHPWAIIHSLIRMISYVLYYFLAYRALIFYQLSIQHLFSETSHIDLKWARWLINGYILIIIITIIIYGFMLQYPHHISILILINIAIVTPYVYLAAYKGITQSTLWRSKEGLEKEVLEEEMHDAEEIELHKTDGYKSKLVKPAPNKEKTQEIVTKTLLLMEEEKIYREAELTLQELSNKLQIPSYLVSQAINEGMKKNFYDLINSYRVEEAKRLLLDPKNRNYTILSVGLDAGFNSKTTFNTVFKKFTGYTPTDFRDRQVAQAVHA